MRPSGVPPVRLIVTTSWLLALAAGGGCRSAPAQTVEAGATTPVSVQAARVETIRSTVVVEGTIVPAAGADLVVHAPDAGRVVELAKEGDAVKAGDLLARFEVESYTQDVTSRELDVANAAARLDTAKAELASKTSLFDRGFVPRNDLETAKAAVTAADATLTHARALLEASQAIAARATVRARFAGVVTKRWHAEGDQVRGDGTDPVLRVIDPSRVQVAVQFPADQLNRVTPGQVATISAPGAAGTETATVVTLPVARTADPTVEVRLSLAGPTALAAGAIVQVEIVLDQRANALVVPAAAVVRAAGTYVMVAGADGLAHRHDVQLGLQTTTLVEIVSGLSAGDAVIVRGLEGLADGAPITIER